MSAPGPGLVVASRYHLDEILGEGGMAVVWRARHTETDRTVALKLVRRDLVRDATIREMFVREARITARIGPNSHIVDVLDAGVDPVLEVPFIAMELLVGEGLDARIQREGPVPSNLVADLVEGIADALDQAHEAGVVHRDLKPQNLFLTRDRKARTDVKILDFGIAKLAESVQQATTQIGTPAYSAPEQLGASWRSISAQRGKPIAEHVSPATDVWAMGLVVYEMLVGATSGGIWTATTLAELPVKMILEPTPVATTRAGARANLLPPGFDTWLARCLDVDATKRFPRAGEAASALLPLLRRAPSTPSVAAPANASAGAAPNPSHGAPTPGWGHGPAFGATPAPPPRTWGQPVAASSPPPPMAHPPTVVSASPNAHVAPTGSPNPYTQATAWGPPQAAWTASVVPALQQWLAMRGAEISLQPDPRPYLAWNPMYFIPRIREVHREVRLVVRDAAISIVDVSVEDTVRAVTGEARPILGFLRSPRVLYPAAVRSREGTGLADGVSRGIQFLDDLFSSAPASKIGDPRFEKVFEVGCDSPHMGNAALPISLRELLFTGFRGKLELRAGGFVVELAAVTRFEPPELDRMIDALMRIYGGGLGL